MAKQKANTDFIDKKTGEVFEGKLNQVVEVVTIRKNGTLRIQQDFQYCPTMAEQHTAHLTDINYLMEKHRPDELAAYIAARNQYRREIVGHDFSKEPSLQEANNVLYQSKQAFKELPEEVQLQFKNHLEFLKFVDNPNNAEKLVQMGLATRVQLDKIKMETDTATTSTTTTTTQEEDKE